MTVSEAAFDALRNRMVEVERQQAVREETLRNIDIRLKGIETTLSRLTWLMITAIGGAAMTFIISGGLHVTGH